MKIEKSIQFLDFLLEPLGITMAYNKRQDFLVFASDNESKGHVCLTYDEKDVCDLGGNMSSVDDAFDNLFNGISKFAIFATCNYIKSVVYNPYLGCRSLEEAMIRRDLLDVQEV